MFNIILFIIAVDNRSSLAFRASYAACVIILYVLSSISLPLSNNVKFGIINPFLLYFNFCFSNSYIFFKTFFFLWSIFLHSSTLCLKILSYLNIPPQAHLILISDINFLHKYAGIKLLLLHFNGHFLQFWIHLEQKQCWHLSHCTGSETISKHI